MNDSGIVNSCIFITQALARGAKFEQLNRTDIQVLLAVKSLKTGCYDGIAKATGINAQTLRSSATSPLMKLVNEDLLEKQTQRFSASHKRTKKMFRLTESGESVVHLIITGQARSREEEQHG